MKWPDKKKIVEIIIFVAVSALLIFVIPKFIIQRVDVDGNSMETTLHDKDVFLAEKVTRYFGAIDRFDIIVFYPNEKEKKNDGIYYVKRVIGLPGETVQIEGQTILINGEPLEESYGSSEMQSAGIASEPIVLGEEEYFVLGDNRWVSKDSRSPEVGLVPLSRIQGKFLLRIFPLKRFGTVN